MQRHLIENAKEVAVGISEAGCGIGRAPHQVAKEDHRKSDEIDKCCL